MIIDNAVILKYFHYKHNSQAKPELTKWILSYFIILYSFSLPDTEQG